MISHVPFARDTFNVVRSCKHPVELREVRWKRSGFVFGTVIMLCLTTRHNTVLGNIVDYRVWLASLCKANHPGCTKCGLRA
jgi:hypothetical protein